jgi:hypothetical protein
MQKFLIGALLMGFPGAGAVLPSQAVAQSADKWEIGPVIRGRNYSVGMPASPSPAGRGWSFDFPYSTRDAGHVHYVTFNPGSLRGKSAIVVRYRVEAKRDVKFVPQETPDAPATVSLYFQRRGDDWSAKRHFEFFRWFSPPNTVQQIAPGEHQMTIRIDDPNWVSVRGRSASTNPVAFEQALAEADRIGLLFGTSGARGHGVFSTGPARFTLLSFQIL